MLKRILLLWAKLVLATALVALVVIGILYVLVTLEAVSHSLANAFLVAVGLLVVAIVITVTRSFNP